MTEHEQAALGVQSLIQENITLYLHKSKLWLLTTADRQYALQELERMVCHQFASALTQLDKSVIQEGVRMALAYHIASK